VAAPKETVTTKEAPVAKTKNKTEMRLFILSAPLIDRVVHGRITSQIRIMNFLAFFERDRKINNGGGGSCFGSHFSKRSLEIDVAVAIELVSKGENGA